jgi:hypothetical protein
MPNTCADRPQIGGADPTPSELASLFDLFQVRSHISKAALLINGRQLAPTARARLTVARVLRAALWESSYQECRLQRPSWGLRAHAW